MYIEINPFFGRHSSINSDLVLGYLTTQQHLHPHSGIQDVLDASTLELGCCRQAIEQALQWLGVDGARSIGRFRRTELVQLARAVHRFWMQSAEAMTASR